MKYSLWILVLVLSISLFVDGENIYDEGDLKDGDDFEFVNEDDKASQQQKTSISERKKWIHDPSNDLCKPLNCKKKELCLLEDAYTAVCVSKKELKRNRDEVLTKNIFLEQEAKREAEAVENGEKLPDEHKNTKSTDEESQQDDDIFYDSKAEQQEDNCKPCPVSKPLFLCGSDNKTYSSFCRLDYHNCLHDTQIKVSCKGFCPCQEKAVESKKHKAAALNEQLKAKYRKTVETMEAAAGNTAKKDKNRRFNGVNLKYTFTPEEIKYDNKHYKYIKFTQESNRDNDETPEIKIKSEKHKVHGYNEMLDNQLQECKGQQLTAIGNRLLDWFSVIMADTKKRRQQTYKSKASFAPSCKVEAKWMFGHLDGNLDGRLSLQELYDLEHDQNERCIKPFIDLCDLNRDSVLNTREWCRCFEKADRPCAAVRRRLSGDLVGNYAPDCDEAGFYKLTQCHHSVGFCWCVDKHGVEFANTRTRDKPNCGEVVKSAASPSVTSDDEDGESEDDDSQEDGSTDRLLVF